MSAPQKTIQAPKTTDKPKRVRTPSTYKGSAQRALKMLQRAASAMHRVQRGKYATPASQAQQEAYLKHARTLVEQATQSLQPFTGAAVTRDDLIPDN